MLPVYRPLGAFRFLLAAMVVVSHTHVLGGPALEWLAPLGLGNMAVMTFFVLSGYVIAEATDVFYRGRPGAFLVNRALRIYPPYFVALALSIAVHVLLAPDIRFYDAAPAEDMFSAKNLTGNALILVVLYGLDKVGITIDYPFVRYAWAVAVELWFYLAFAFLVLLPLGRRTWPLVVAALIAVFVHAMASEAFGGLRGWIPYFMLGVAIYHRQWALAAVALALVNWHAFAYIGKNAHANVAGGLIILDALILVLVILSTRTIAGLKPLDRFLGDLTYPLYLNHYAVSIAGLTLLAPGAAAFTATLAASVLFSYVAMLVTEPFTRRVRNRIRGRAIA